jgi:hypothetical protein
MKREQLPLYAIALAVLIVGLAYSGVPLGSLLILPLVLACPLMMFFMMRGMDHGDSGHDHNHDHSNPSAGREDHHDHRDTSGR